MTPVEVILAGTSALLVGRGEDAASPCRDCVQRSWAAAHRAELGGEHVDLRGLDRWPVTRAAATALRLQRDRPGERGPESAVVLQLDTLLARPVALEALSWCPRCASARDRRPELEVSVPVSGFRGRAAADLPLDVDRGTDPAGGPLGGRTVRELDAWLVPRAGGSAPIEGRMVQWSGIAPTMDGAARVGVLEGFERRAGARRDPADELIYASFAALTDDPARAAVDPREFGLPADPAALDLDPWTPDSLAPWVTTRSVLDGRVRLVPEQRMYDRPTPGTPSWWRECSNGTASGSSLVEAVLHGLLEVLERDAALLAWYRGAPVPEIDPASCGRAVQTYLLRLRQHGLRARFFDVRVEHLVPVVLAMVEADGSPAGLAFGSAADLDPGDALAAALLEAGAVARKLTATAARLDPAARERLIAGPARRDVQQHWRRYALPELDAGADFLRRPGGTVRTGELADRVPAWHPRELRRVLADVARSVIDCSPEASDVLYRDVTTAWHERLGLRCAKVVVPGLLPIDFGPYPRAETLPRFRRLAPGPAAPAHPYA